VTLPDEDLPPEAEMALAHTPPALRGALATALALDARLARIAGQTSEVMLGQMRLAWWRDTLGGPRESRPQGDAVLDAIGLHWQGRENALGELVDAWEILVAAERMERDDILAFARGRAAAFAALAADRAQAERVRAAGMRWAIAEAAPRLSEATERERFVEIGLEHLGERGSLPRPLRGIAVLDALAVRALKRGGRPLMEGRGAALAAMRAAILGR
jgi:phytoene synthase